jgi:murein L,D-transpeptidase YafK
MTEFKIALMESQLSLQRYCFVRFQWMGQSAKQVAKSKLGRRARFPASVIAIPKNSDYYRPYVFVVDKSARSLEIWKFDDSTEGRRKLVKSDSHPADLGKNLGPKVAEGDHKTPEGIYFLLDRLDGSAIDFKQYGSRAYTTNYPNYFDALDGKTGSGIWLHAVPDDVPLTRGSRGCVVVRNGVIGTLDPYIQLGKTPIVISDKIEPRSAEEMEAEQAKLTTWLNLWTTAWAGKSIDQYMAFYDQDFKSLGLNKARLATVQRTTQQAVSKNFCSDFATSCDRTSRSRDRPVCAKLYQRSAKRLRRKDAPPYKTRR